MSSDSESKSVGLGIIRSSKCYINIDYILQEQKICFEVLKRSLDANRVLFKSKIPLEKLFPSKSCTALSTVSKVKLANKMVQTDDINYNSPMLPPDNLGPVPFVRSTKTKRGESPVRDFSNIMYKETYEVSNFKIPDAVPVRTKHANYCDLDFDGTKSKRHFKHRHKKSGIKRVKSDTKIINQKHPDNNNFLVQEKMNRFICETHKQVYMDYKHEQHTDEIASKKDRKIFHLVLSPREQQNSFLYEGATKNKAKKIIVTSNTLKPASPYEASEVPQGRKKSVNIKELLKPNYDMTVNELFVKRNYKAAENSEKSITSFLDTGNSQHHHSHHHKKRKRRKKLTLTVFPCIEIKCSSKHLDLPAQVQRPKMPRRHIGNIQEKMPDLPLPSILKNKPEEEITPQIENKNDNQQHNNKFTYEDPICKKENEFIINNDNNDISPSFEDPTPTIKEKITNIIFSHENKKHEEYNKKIDELCSLIGSLLNENIVKDEMKPQKCNNSKSSVIKTPKSRSRSLSRNEERKNIMEAIEVRSRSSNREETSVVKNSRCRSESPVDNSEHKSRSSSPSKIIQEISSPKRSTSPKYQNPFPKNELQNPSIKQILPEIEVPLKNTLISIAENSSNNSRLKSADTSRNEKKKLNFQITHNIANAVTIENKDFIFHPVDVPEIKMDFNNKPTSSQKPGTIPPHLFVVPTHVNKFLNPPIGDDNFKTPALPSESVSKSPNRNDPSAELLKYKIAEIIKNQIPKQNWVEFQQTNVSNCNSQAQNTSSIYDSFNDLLEKNKKKKHFPSNKISNNYKRSKTLQDFLMQKNAMYTPESTLSSQISNGGILGSSMDDSLKILQKTKKTEKKNEPGSILNSTFLSIKKEKVTNTFQKRKEYYNSLKMQQLKKLAKPDITNNVTSDNSKKPEITKKSDYKYNIIVHTSPESTAKTRLPQPKPGTSKGYKIKDKSSAQSSLSENNIQNKLEQGIKQKIEKIPRIKTAPKKFNESFQPQKKRTENLIAKNVVLNHFCLINNENPLRYYNKTKEITDFNTLDITSPESKSINSTVDTAILEDSSMDQIIEKTPRKYLKKKISPNSSNELKYTKSKIPILLKNYVTSKAGPQGDCNKIQLTPKEKKFNKAVYQENGKETLNYPTKADSETVLINKLNAFFNSTTLNYLEKNSTSNLEQNAIIKPEKEVITVYHKDFQNKDGFKPSPLKLYNSNSLIENLSKNGNIANVKVVNHQITLRNKIQANPVKLKYTNEIPIKKSPRKNDFNFEVPDVFVYKSDKNRYFFNSKKTNKKHPKTNSFFDNFTTKSSIFATKASKKDLARKNKTKIEEKKLKAKQEEKKLNENKPSIRKSKSWNFNRKTESKIPIKKEPTKLNKKEIINKKPTKEKKKCLKKSKLPTRVEPVKTEVPKQSTVLDEVSKLCPSHCCNPDVSDDTSDFRIFQVKKFNSKPDNTLKYNSKRQVLEVDKNIQVDCISIKNNQKTKSNIKLLQFDNDKIKKQKTTKTKETGNQIVPYEHKLFPQKTSITTTDELLKCLNKPTLCNKATQKFISSIPSPHIRSIIKQPTQLLNKKSWPYILASKSKMKRKVSFKDEVHLLGHFENSDLNINKLFENSEADAECVGNKKKIVSKKKSNKFLAILEFIFKRNHKKKIREG